MNHPTSNTATRTIRERGQRLLIGMLVLLLLGIASVDAAEVCVDTPQELRAAFDRFIDDDEDMTINIAQGEYAILANISNRSADLILRGGYTDGSCSSRSYDPSLTVLRVVLDDYLNVIARHLAIGSLSFEEFEDGATFWADGSLTGNGVLEMTRTRFVDPSSRGILLVGEEVYVTEAVVSNQATNVEACALDIIGPDDGNDFVSIQHSTVTGNPNYGVCIARSFLTPQNDGFQVWIDNNVLYDNGLSLSIDDTTEYVVRNNIVDGFLVDFGAANPGASGNNLPDDPRFIDPAADDFRLGNSSPAINSAGTATFGGLPQFDVVGNPRFVGPLPDMGAYESNDDGDGDLLTVTSTFDSNTTGTLRWALNQANANPNFSIIIFNIPGACPRVISPGSELPKIITRVAILGYTQPGSSSNSGNAGGGTDANLCIHLAGQASRDYGLHVPVAAGSNGQLNLSGMQFSGFLQAAIALEAGVGSLVTGNHISGNPGIGILVAGSAEDTQIGGGDYWQRNLIQGSSYGVALNPFGNGNTVENNVIGLSADGNSVTATSGNDVGIGISGNGNFIRKNAIAGNGSGIAIFNGDRNYISGNTFGRRVGFFACPFPPCNGDLFNTSHGVLIQGSAFDNGIWSNTIANSGGAGIRITEGQQNSFSGNRIWNSGEFGIDLNGFGRQIPNNDADPTEAATANRGLNHPAISTARGGHGNGLAKGTLTTTNGTYRIEAFASDTCAGDRGQARWPLGGRTVTITNAAPGGNGSIAFDMNLQAPNFVALDNYFITMTATDNRGAIGMGNTSELSGCRQYVYDDVIFADDFEL
jgi:hypothetical protein